MFGLDEYVASLSDGASFALVAVVAILLGLRHATDPDHLVAVSTLVTSAQDAGRRAAALGLAWGTGHALSLFAFGLPIVLYRAYLPERVQQGAETAVGLLVIGLAVWLLVRWRRGAFAVGSHAHAGGKHRHAHGGTHGHPPRSRSPLASFAVGLVHGMGGSAGVGVLLVATVDSHFHGVIALGLLAAFTTVSMTILSAGLGLGLVSGPARRSLARFAPALGLSSLAFGLWYALGALSLAPYYF
jgi:hypothetical protein